MIVFASILGAILATGLLALTPSPMIKNAGVQMYEDQYNYHDNNNNYYQQDDYQHGYNDDNSYYKEDNQYGYDDSNYRDYNEYSYDDNSRVQLNFADKYSAYPSNDHKFACKTGQFEGFFVKSSEFCDLEIPPGPEGPQGEQGEPGINGQNGAQGPQGPAGINVINASNSYTIFGERVTIPIDGQSATSFANCDVGDSIINAGHSIGTSATTTGTYDIRFFGPVGLVPSEATWQTFIIGLPDTTVTTFIVCFDNPPPHFR